MAGGLEFALAGVLTVLPTPMLVVNILFAVALFTFPSVMVWLDRQGRMPTALPWFHLLVVTPVLAFLLLMISFQPNSYCNTILQHAEFRAFYVLFLPFCRSSPTWLAPRRWAGRGCLDASSRSLAVRV